MLQTSSTTSSCCEQSSLLTIILQDTTTPHRQSFTQSTKMLSSGSRCLLRPSQGSRALPSALQQVVQPRMARRSLKQQHRPNEAATRELVSTKQLTLFDEYFDDYILTPSSSDTVSVQPLPPITCIAASSTEVDDVQDAISPKRLEEIHTNSIAALERSFKLASLRSSGDDSRESHDAVMTLQQLEVSALVHQHSSDASSSSNEITEPKLNRVFMGCAEDKGQKKYMEDRHAFSTISYSSGPSDDWMGGVSLESATAYAAVLDGHGGHQTAAHGARQLHHNIFKKLNKSAVHPGHHSRRNSISGVGRARSQSPVRSPRQRASAVADHAASVLDAITDSFIQFDEAWREETSGMPFDQSGSTAVVAMVNKNNLIIANAGDSVAVLARAGSAIRLSKLHNADNESEAERVRAAGGVFCKGKSGLRVMQNPASLPAGERYAKQPHVANTRSFGDYKLKRHNYPIVSAEPYVTKVPLTLEDTLLLLASDGVTDVMSDQEIVDVALGAIQQAHSSAVSNQDLADAAASAVKSEALQKGAWDNLTAVVMMLDWQE